MRRPPSVLSVLLLLAVASGAAAQNLLVNPDFDVDVSGWNTTGSDIEILWNPTDALGSPSSGSGEVVNSFVGTASGRRAWQCVPVTGGATYHLRGRMLVPSGQSTLWGGQLGIWWSSTPSCSDSLVTVVSPHISWPQDLWIEVVAPLAVAPAPALAAKISLAVDQWAPGGTVSILYDHLAFQEVLFADGFEGGTTAAWVTVLP